MFRPEFLAQLRDKNLDGSPLADAFKCLPGEPTNHVKSAVLHLLWRQELLIDPTERATKWASRIEDVGMTSAGVRIGVGTSDGELVEIVEIHTGETGMHVVLKGMSKKTIV